MKLITRDTDYAIRALSYIAASQEKVVSVSELVRELKVPRSFLRKNLQILDKKGILKSYKGKGGGFALALPPHKISIMDLVEIFQGHFRLNECFFKKHICPNTKDCALKRKIDKIEKYVIRELSAVNIAYLSRLRRRPRACTWMNAKKKLLGGMSLNGHAIPVGGITLDIA